MLIQLSVVDDCVLANLDYTSNSSAINAPVYTI